MTSLQFFLFTRRNLGRSRLFQIGLILAFWQLGELMTRLLRLPFPGAITGMFLVLLLLLSGTIKVRSMRRGAEWFLAEMLLFFVPAVLAVIDHHEFLGWVGVKIIAVILAGTIIVMCTTALAIDLGYRLMLRQEARREHAE